MNIVKNNDILKDKIKIFGSKGYNHGEFNKIRDMETFMYNNEHLILIVDHRNHRLELFKINNDNTFIYLTTFNGGNEPFCLPANILYIGNGLFICTEVQDSERVQIIKIIKDRCSYKIIPQFILKGCSGPGGLSQYKNYIFIPEYMTSSIQICNLINNDYVLNPIQKFTDEYLNNPIDSVIIGNKLLIIDCKKKNKGVKSIIIYEIDDSNDLILIFIKEITTAFGQNFDFSYSAGAICSIENNILIADSENDRIIFGLFNDEENDIEFKWQYKNTDLFLFPTSVCFGRNNTIMVSCFHHFGKTELEDYDKILIIPLKNFNIKSELKQIVNKSIILYDDNIDEIKTGLKIFSDIVFSEKKK